MPRDTFPAWWISSMLVTVVMATQGDERASAISAPEVTAQVSFSKGSAADALGPLRVHPTNPRYFADGRGKAVFLTGSHHWNNFQDSGEVGQPVRVFDYARYLDLLTSHGHNFIRLWVSEGAINRSPYADPLPYVRTGPGTALDGKPKVDLDRFNQAYFDRLRSRVIAARDRGIYVGIMLFNGWSVYDHGYGSPWPLHPFNRANNINGIDGDLDVDGEGKDVHTLKIGSITARQEAYVRKVVDTVNDLDNVLYEITNETAIFSRDWQYYMIRFIKDYERTKLKQHPVGMTDFDASPAEAARVKTMDALLSSPADWISPGNDERSDYGANPPASTGQKVVLSDTDHFFGVGGDHDWVWKSFLRGLNPIYMDPLDFLTGRTQDPPGADAARRAMGDTHAYAGRMELAAMIPHDELCSSTFCLANPGYAYLVYLPFGSHWLEPYLRRLPSQRLRAWVISWNIVRRTVTVDLGLSTTAWAVEWFNPRTGERTAVKSMVGGGRQGFTAPFPGDAVLYLAAS